jgi:hypothetical protein
MELRHFRYFAAVPRPLKDTGRLGVVRHIALRDLVLPHKHDARLFLCISNEALSPAKIGMVSRKSWRSFAVIIVTGKRSVPLCFLGGQSGTLRLHALGVQHIRLSFQQGAARR